MNNVLFCIPLKPDCLEKFKTFCEETLNAKSEEWKDMLARYDMSSVKVWHKNIEGREHVFVYHDTGPSFAEKIQNWGNSDHPFDQWFGAKLNELYDTGATQADAAGLFELFV